MRSLGIITDSIDVTVMGVGCTLVSIYENKAPNVRKVYLTNSFTGLYG